MLNQWRNGPENKNNSSSWKKYTEYPYDLERYNQLETIANAEDKNITEVTVKKLPPFFD